jgi:hypothetical protein
MAKASSKGTTALVGEKMIQVRLRFWTNKLAAKRGRVLPKQAWTSGMVTIDANETHGIKSRHKSMPFHSLMDIPVVIEKILMANGIKLHPSRKMKKYMA